MVKKVRVLVVGVGMKKFEKNGRRDDFDYNEMEKEDVKKDLNDDGLKIYDIKKD